MTMINRDDSSTSFNKVVSDLTTSDSVLNLGTSTFYFAMYLPYNGKNLLTDSTYIDLQMKYVVQQSGKQTSTSISYDICNQTSISFSDTTLLTKRNILTTFVCPKSLNYTIQGNSYSDKYSYIQIILKRCSGLNCKSTTAINSAISGATLSFTMINTYFDLNDYLRFSKLVYSSPVKTYLDDRINVAISSGFTKTTTLFTQQRSSSKSDDYFSFLDETTSDSFIGVESYVQDFDLEANSGNVLSAFVVKLDPVQQQYTRSVYTFLQFSGDLGGVFQILEILGTIFVGLFAQKLFNYSILSNIYQVDDRNHKNKNAVCPANNSQNQNITKANDDSSIHLNHETKADNKFDQSNVLKRMMEVIRNRKSYSYSICDVLYNILWILKCCSFGLGCLKQCRHRHRLYGKGVNKYTKEMDVVSFVKMIRRVEMMVNSHLTQRQRMLETFQRSNVIHTDSDSDEVNPSLQEPFNRSIALKTALDHSTKLNKIIEFYESEELEDKDVKLFEGIIYQQNKNSFADYSAECIYPFQNISNKSLNQT